VASKYITSATAGVDIPGRATAYNRNNLNEIFTMSETEVLGRLAAVEQLAVMAFAVVVASDRSSDAVQKAAHILDFAAKDSAADRGMRPDIRKEAIGAFDEIASKVSEKLKNLKR
jgi:hypothetical protein